MSIIQEAKLAIKLFVVFVVVAVIAMLTSCESPVGTRSGIWYNNNTEDIVRIKVTRHVSYDSLIVYKGENVWWRYPMLYSDSYYDEDKGMVIYEVYDTIEIAVPSGDSVVAYTKSIDSPEMNENRFKLVSDSVYVFLAY